VLQASSIAHLAKTMRSAAPTAWVTDGLEPVSRAIMSNGDRNRDWLARAAPWAYLCSIERSVRELIAQFQDPKYIIGFGDELLGESSAAILERSSVGPRI
jgi:hypothetical protein